MKITTTLSKYLARTYFRNMLVFLLSLLAIIYLFDTVELIRRASKHDDVPMGLVLTMGLYKLPDTGQIMLPFAILFSAIFTFWQLTRRSELTIVRASGFSVWQFLAPVLGVAMAIGLFQMFIINPVGSVFVSKFEQLESTYLKRQENQVAVFKEGLWLRQSIGQNGNYIILNAGKINQQDWVLRNVTVFFFRNDDTFLQRLDSRETMLEKGRWLFRDVTLYKPGEGAARHTTYALPTPLTVQDIQESFAGPETMSFWRLPGYIQTLEETGFDATSLKVHYQNLLSQPLMFMAMVLLAATVSMRSARSRGAFTLIAAGVLIGFVVFFMSSFLQALGASGQIPVMLAAWTPALVCLLMGVGVMMHMEDG